MEAALSGILAMMTAEREETEGATRRKTEVVLAEAGQNNQEIGQLVRKGADAVSKVVERDRKYGLGRCPSRITPASN
jgi:hypothetical protein